MRASEIGRPFFLAAGFFKPRRAFIAPKKYWDFLSELAGLPVPSHVVKALFRMILTAK